MAAALGHAGRPGPGARQRSARPGLAVAGPGRGCWHRACWRRLRSAPPGAAGDLRAVGAHLGGLRLAWLGVVVAAQGVALAGGTAAQRQLLAAGGASLRWLPVSGWPAVCPLAGPAVRLRRLAAGRAARPAARRIGGVEGGMLGALTLTGTPPAAAAAASSSTGWPGAGPSAPPDRGGNRPRPPLPGRPGPGCVPAANGRAAVTVPGQPVHRPGGTVVPRAATEDSTPKPTIE